MAAKDDYIGFTFEAGTRDEGGLEFPLGGTKALALLKELGLIKLTELQVGEVLYGDPTPAPSGTKRFEIAPSWLCSDDK